MTAILLSVMAVAAFVLVVWLPFEIVATVRRAYASGYDAGRKDAAPEAVERPGTMATFERCARGELTPEQAASEMLERDLDAIEGDWKRAMGDMRTALKRRKEPPK